MYRLTFFKQPITQIKQPYAWKAELEFQNDDFARTSAVEFRFLEMKEKRNEVNEMIESQCPM